jgi:hypothetical protein
MDYVPPFDIVRDQVMNGHLKGKQNGLHDAFRKAVRLLISAVHVDEDWYLTRYQDIAKAVAGGSVASARQHFVDDGYFEGRMPFAMTVNEEWYLNEYPDVANDVRSGRVSSAQRHFETHGYREGRLPFPQALS